MRNEDKLIKVAHYNTKLNSVLGYNVLLLQLIDLRDC